MKSSKILFFSLALALIHSVFSITTGYAALSMAVPTGQDSFPVHGPIGLPIISIDPSQAMPIGLGPAASGGDTISVQVGLAPFSGPVDIYFGYFAPSLDPQHIYILTSNNTFTPLSVSDPLHEGPAPWKTNVSSEVNESLVSALGTVPVSSLPAGTYTAYLLVTPAGSLDSYYLWTTAIDGANNVLPISVNGSLCSTNSYMNKPCVSITVCTPGTSACQTINDILLDAGSYGLRIFKQALNVSLTQETVSGGSLAECAQFGSAEEWGPIQIANVILGNEPAVQVPIQVIDFTFGTVPNACKNADLSPADGGFNGILGVGLFVQDCGSACSTILRNGMYYACSGAKCTGTVVPLFNQVQNPVALLPQDNNGIIVQLPVVPLGGVPSVNGSLVLGIGTQSNNTPHSVTAYPTDQYGGITTVFNGIQYSSFLDTGSNGLFFTVASANNLPTCPSPDSDWFCPSSPVTLSSINGGATGSPSGTVSFQIGNFDSLLNNFSNNVFAELGGSMPGGFDWGLPFFFGRSVFIGFEGKASSLGLGTFFAY